MCQVMITVRTEGKPQHRRVTLPDASETFQVIVAGTV